MLPTKLKLIAPMVLAPIASAQCPVSFAPAVNYPVGQAPRSVAVGDLNADGILDLAVANNYAHGAGTISILHGAGDGMFAAAASIPAGKGPWAIAIGDMDGDGRPDLVVTNEYDHAVSVYLNSGTISGGPPSFALPVNRGSAGYFPHSVALGDLNDDGRPDLAATNEGWGSSQGSVSVLLNTSEGPGSFSVAAATPYEAGVMPQFVAVGDVNADGHLDLAVANNNSQGVSLLLGNGSGMFGTATNIGTGYNVFTVAIADLNADDTPDLALSRHDKAAVLLGDGSGAFGSPTVYPVGSYPHMVAVGDLNGDGSPDLVAANSFSDDVSILLNAGAGSFGSAVNFPAGDYPLFIAMADFNDDGRTDLAVVNAFSHNVSILLNTSPCNLDSDRDGLADVDEIAIGTDRFNPDTDGDGLLDGAEVEVAMGGTCPDPLDPDSDGDTLLDGFEVTLGTMPCDVDSDGDLVPDDIDPEPTVPAGTQGVLAQILRNEAIWVNGSVDPWIDGLAPSLFNGNDRLKMARRNTIANKLQAAANAVEAGNFNGEIQQLEALLQTLSDWMAESPEQAALRYDIEQVILILQQL